MDKLMTLHTCPVCGWPGLSHPPYDAVGDPSYEVCGCCGFEFGFDDSPQGYTFGSYRKDWIKRGMPWHDPSAMPPWDAATPLLQEDAERVLSWIDDTWPGASEELRGFNWLGLAEAAALNATTKVDLAWAQIATAIYNHLGHWSQVTVVR